MIGSRTARLWQRQLSAVEALETTQKCVVVPKPKPNATGSRLKKDPALLIRELALKEFKKSKIGQSNNKNLVYNKCLIKTLE